VKRLAALAMLIASPGFAQYADPIQPDNGFQPFVLENQLLGSGAERRLALPEAPRGDELAAWRKDLVGKPAFAADGGRIGEVVDLAVATDGSLSSVVVAVTGALARERRLVPVPWQWMRTQLGGARVVMPDAFALLQWAVQGGDEVGGLAGWRTSWLDGVPARLQGGDEVGRVDGLLLGPNGQVAEVVVRGESGSLYGIPRDQVRVDPTATLVTLMLSHSEMLALGPPGLPSTSPEPPLAALPER
jgi:hypothetical protein